MRSFYEYIDYLDINNPDKAQEKILIKWSISKLEQVARTLAGLIISDKKPEKYLTPSLYNFTANSAMGGGPFPCAHTTCRLSNIDQLARFAVLYSDTILIPSPFDIYDHDDIFIDREQLFCDILILILLRPLIENGIIGFSGALGLCSECLKTTLKVEKNFKDPLNILLNILEEEYLKNITVKLVWHFEPEVVFEGPEYYGFHGYMVIHFRKYVPDELKSLFKKGSEVLLPPDVVKELHILYMIFDPISDDLMLQNVWVDMYNLSYLTNREIDVNVLNAIHLEDNRLISNNITESLTHLLPTVQNVDISNILELRMKEGESFKVYRDTVTSVLNNVSTDPVSLKLAYRDLIEPEINKINLTIRNSKRNIFKSLKNKVLFYSGAMTIGLYGNLFSFDVGKVLAGLGGLKFAYDIFEQVDGLFTEPSSVRDNKFYFLWKLQTGK